MKGREWVKKLGWATVGAAVVLALAGCEEAASPTAAIEGEWAVTEFWVWSWESSDDDGDPQVTWTREDLAVTHAMTLTFTDTLFVWTYDPAYWTRTAWTGTYELLPGDRVLLEESGHDPLTSVARYQVKGSTLTLWWGSPPREQVLTATRAR